MTPEQTVLTAEMPLHLEDHLEAATFTEVAGADVPAASLTAPVEWRFDQPQPDWKATPPLRSVAGRAALSHTDDALRVTLSERTRASGNAVVAGVHVDLPDWQPILLNRTTNAAPNAAEIARTSDALRVTLSAGSRRPDKLLHGGIYVDLPGWRREEWAHIVVRARRRSPA
jgi:hypothetical protein